MSEQEPESVTDELLELINDIFLSGWKNFLNSFIRLLFICFYWSFETTAFIFLPLVVYYFVFITLDFELKKLMKLPEWMFISIILHGETLRKAMFAMSKYKGFDTVSVLIISSSILGIVILAILLAFTIFSHYNKNFILSTDFYIAEASVFSGAVISSLFLTIVLKWDDGDTKYMIFDYPMDEIEKDNIEANND